MSELQDKIFRSTPLSRVAESITMEWDEDVVMRLNGQRVIEAECDPNTEINEATPAKVVETIKKDIEAIELPAGYSMRWVGEGELQGDAIANLLKYVPLTIFIILAILLLLFNSWKKVILILICFPFVFCGIVSAITVGNKPANDIYGNHRNVGIDRYDGEKRNRTGGRDKQTADGRKEASIYGCS